MSFAWNWQQSSENFMNRFETLLERHLNQTASKSETAELFRLINTGEYDDILEMNMLQSLQDEMLSIPSQEEKERMAGIYNRRLSGTVGEQKVKVISMQSWLAAAAVVAGVLFGTWWFLIVRSGNQPLGARNEVKTVPAADAHLASFTDKQLIRLPDGSMVLLNNGSQLTYNPDNFGKSAREVTLTGEGFFDVKHDPAQPFIVYTGKVKTTVLGTAFNISASAGTQQVKVTVTRGKVKVGDEERTFDVITPDQQIVVNTLTSDFTKENVNANVAAGWKDQFIILDNVTMQEAVSVIAQRFHTKLTLMNENLEKCHVSASFLNGESLEHILKVITAVNQISYTFQPDGSVVLEGGNTCQ
ncbi:FecR family protein [Dyadobacter alkalitolerans]|uniref:FecR family protein n=1 Tax=Dyadobacter alkalitolerans TaxID=492736 RepID=UPI00040E483E|nr:FecR domain-containing protein [Dyadobacter alkalitolerans]